ncbi:IS3 family transposase [Carnobacterium maltaromaticum]
MYHGLIYTSFERLKWIINKCINYYNHHIIKKKLDCSSIQYRDSMTA